MNSSFQRSGRKGVAARSKSAPVTDWVAVLEEGPKSIKDLVLRFFPHVVLEESAKVMVFARLKSVSIYLGANPTGKRLASKRVDESKRNGLKVYWVEPITVAREVGT